MEPLRTTTARLRRTFAYPTDESSSTGTPDALDEEEQESLITHLTTQNTSRNARFRHLLLLLPTLSSIPYLISLLTLSRPQSSLLALTSLASTTYLLYTLPPPETGIPYLDSLSSSSSTSPPGQSGILSSSDSDSDTERRRHKTLQRMRSRASSFSQAGLYRSPLEVWLPYLNLGLCGVLFVIGILKGARSGGESSLVVDLLPGIIYAVVLAAKMVMAGVDPERELGGLRYEFKGA